MTRWLILTATLPTRRARLRVRVWRALKATGARHAARGRLPAAARARRRRTALWDIEGAMPDGGRRRPHAGAAGARRRAGADLSGAVRPLRAVRRAAAIAQGRARRAQAGRPRPSCTRGLRALEQQLQAIQASDFFPGKAGEKAASALAALRREVELHLSPGEPAASGGDDRAPRARISRAAPGRRASAPGSTGWRPPGWCSASSTSHPTFIWLADPRSARRPRSASTSTAHASPMSATR